MLSLTQPQLISNLIGQYVSIDFNSLLFVSDAITFRLHHSTYKKDSDLPFILTLPLSNLKLALSLPNSPVSLVPQQHQLTVISTANNTTLKTTIPAINQTTPFNPPNTANPLFKAIIHSSHLQIPPDTVTLSFSNSHLKIIYKSDFNETLVSLEKHAFISFESTIDPPIDLSYKNIHIPKDADKIAIHLLQNGVLYFQVFLFYSNHSALFHYQTTLANS
jgi:hypothetical protein